MSFENIIINKQNNIAVITINRPAQLNALIGLRDDTEAASGGTDIDAYLNNQVRLIDRMLKANGYEQQ